MRAYMIGLTSLGMYRILHIRSFLEDEVTILKDNYSSKLKSVAGWGRRPSFYKAQTYASKYNLPLLTLEDGFIRSIGLGVEGYQPLSIVVDDQGIYFDASQPSQLETLILQRKDQPERAQRAINYIIENELSKYNHAPMIAIQVAPEQKNILIVDQTYGDQSICCAGATPATFRAMLTQARQDHPDAVLWIKTHPDVISGKKKGHFTKEDLLSHQIRIIDQACNPIALLKQMNEVYVVSSHMGFEALMLGKKVHCFGVPWYAGWGVTQDKYAPLAILKGRRQVQGSLTQLFSAAYFQYARYVNPNTGKRCELEDVLGLLVLQKKWNLELTGQVNALGFSRWKKAFIDDYLRQPSNSLNFRWFFPKQATAGEHYIIWGNKKPHIREKLQQNKHAKVWRMEDGFIRSVGLGANLIRPLSLVLDDCGIYYDPQQPSRLENILNNIDLNSEQIQRARLLRERLIAEQLSKYNVGEPEDWPTIPTGQKIILVPGQVEDDASVKLGGCGICTNLDLLKLARKQNPDAWIIYKPHPDVEAGLRPGKIVTEVLLNFANSVTYKLNMPACLEKVDEIHTISSLTGFEALLRQKKVYCYGLPFYAGWGLTIDRLPCQRRSRFLTIDELVYGTLISYPLYKLPIKGSDYLATPEQVVDYIVIQRKKESESGRIKSASWLARLRALLIYKR